MCDSALAQCYIDSTRNHEPEKTASKSCAAVRLGHLWPLWRVHPSGLAHVRELCMMRLWHSPRSSVMPRSLLCGFLSNALVDAVVDSARDSDVLPARTQDECAIDARSQIRLIRQCQVMSRGSVRHGCFKLRSRSVVWRGQRTPWLLQATLQGVSSPRTDCGPALGALVNTTHASFSPESTWPSTPTLILSNRFAMACRAPRMKCQQQLSPSAVAIRDMRTARVLTS